MHEVPCTSSILDSTSDMGIKVDLLSATWARRLPQDRMLFNHHSYCGDCMGSVTDRLCV
jgi:hypothetical protein